MKASSVSTAAISEAMRYSLMKTQASLVKAQKEQSTGFYADKGLALGARTSQSVTFNRELERIKGIIDSNSMATARLSATQQALSGIENAAQTFLSALGTAVSGDSQSAMTQNIARDTLGSMSSLLNSSLNGEYLFAGINTDVKPISDFSDPSTAGVTAFQNAFVAKFGFSMSDPQAASISATDMDDFITNNVEPMFLGAGWSDWSSASDQPIVGRIALNETTETSVSANNAGVRKLAMAGVVIEQLMSANLSTGVRQSLIKRTVSVVGEAMGDLANLRSVTGIAEKRVSDASDRMDQQSTLLEKHILKTEGVDPYEAATRVSDLLSHIETAYALTARMQQLSLLKYLS
ncbi:flagellar hook-associated protein 3 FlgL [Mesorhizobium soli]|jgi:flagellar hook-associated protein 3 FlgL|uniref:flagellar hook-associated family protein n=1 Tax=Pseudaminobacter soli (ex Li et al. 2025) TaxID=1295366 RepID=UPI0024747095|nr:flagellar hook-associated family protein [Mesorhizobium soli]MDH6233391.1 flagellar hook-associated protein 3 FlgL [Mesorhizobium soli]